MNRISLFAIPLFTLLTLTLVAQDKHDFVWTLGYGPNLPDVWAGGNLINFQKGNPEITYFEITYDMDNPVNMADQHGNLQFYSSGCDVLNKSYGVMENGGELSAGSLHNLYCDDFGWGYISYQGILALPFPGDTNKYVLFHSKMKNTSADSTTVLYSLIDMAANNGLGTVVEKNIFLQHGFLSRTYTAVRHANGRDWWVVIPEELKSIYNFYLLDPGGIHGPFVQSPDSQWIAGHIGNGNCAFSPDGSKFIRTGGLMPAAIRIYDYDRCTGVLSNAVTLTVPDTILSYPWACFSPNSRYLYLTNNVFDVYQYDNQSNDISASVQLVGQFDGFHSVWNVAAGPYAMAIGPDNRIYVTSGGGVNVLHTIEKPDLPGLACDYRPHNITLPATILFLPPNQPNYRLYNVPESSCDTLGVRPPIVAFWRSEQDSLASSAQVNFTDLSYYQPHSWLWDFGDGTSDTTQSPVHQYLPGTYTACLTVCNAIGNCNTLCREIQVTTVRAYEPEYNELSFHLIPNPAAQSTTIQFLQPTPENCRLEIYDITGRQLNATSIPTASMSHELPVYDYSNGCYFICITAQGRVVAREKLVVLH